MPTIFFTSIVLSQMFTYVYIYFWEEMFKYIDFISNPLILVHSWQVIET